MRLIKRRWAIVLAVLGCAAGATTALAQPKPLKLAVNDGRTGPTSMIEIMGKYDPLVELFSRALGGRKIILLNIREFDRMDQLLANQEPDIAVMRPADRAARAVVANNYRLVANARPDAHCVLLVRTDSAVKALPQITGKRIVMGEKDAYMTNVCRAELNSKGIDLDKEKVEYVREQATIGVMIDGNVTDVGGVASFSPLARNAEKRGFRVLHRSVQQPTLPVIASVRLSPADMRALQDALVGLSASEDGRKLLASLNVDGFVPGETEKLRALFAWLDKR